MSAAGPTDERHSRHHWWIAAGVVALLLVAGLVILWIKVPLLYGTGDAATTATGTTRSGILTAAAALIAASAAGAGLYFTQQTVMESRRANRATDRRDRYAKAIEQLGHDKAPVRLGAIYSLERLAQDDLELRQAVVDVLCAYLRMPFTPPKRYERVGQPETEGAKDRFPVHTPDPDYEQYAEQELLVRKTTQRLLAVHLYPPLGISGVEAQEVQASPRLTFWPKTNLDLSDANLVDFDVRTQFRFPSSPSEGGISVAAAIFRGATFFGDTNFTGATFSGSTSFIAATFLGDALFSFATFSGATLFEEATFSATAWFPRAAFPRGALFTGASFCGPVSFIEATYDGPTLGYFEGVQVLHVNDPDLKNNRWWPYGWALSPDADNPTRGTLVERDPDPRNA